MLNEIIVSQGVLNGLRFLTNVTMVVFLLLGLGMAGVAVSRRMDAPSRARRVLGIASKGLVVLGLLLAALVVASLGMAAWQTRPEPMHWDVDLSGHPSLRPFQIRKCSEWKIGDTVNINCIFEGVISLNARFPRSRTVRENGHALWATGVGDDLTSLHLFLSPMSETELVARLAPVFADWEIPSTALEEWRSETTNRRRYFTTRKEQTDLPWLEVSISGLDSPPDASRPWVASLEWHWEPRS
jgi:hypothetical protein